MLVIGYLSKAGVCPDELPDNPVHLNPAETDEIVVGDKLVALKRGVCYSSYYLGVARHFYVGGACHFHVCWAHHVYSFRDSFLLQDISEH